MTIQQMIHDVQRLTLEIIHFPKTEDRGFEFWTINLRVKDANGYNVTETSYVANTEPKTLIALHGLRKENTLFEAPKIEVEANPVNAEEIVFDGVGSP